VRTPSLDDVFLEFTGNHFAGSHVAGSAVGVLGC
jgi:hypothetical protein